MKQISEKFNPNESEASDLATLELKANLNPEQRVYLEVLKDKMKKILGGKTKQELAKAGDLVSLNKYRAVLVDILEFLKTKEIKNDRLIFVTLEGREVKIEIPKELKYWGEFYQKQGIDWIEMPKKIELTDEDREELTKGAETLCPDGNFEKLKMLIIPAGLAATGEKYWKLLVKMSKGYNNTNKTGSFNAYFDFAPHALGQYDGLKNKSDKLQIILVKDIQELKNDEVYARTLNKSVIKSGNEKIGWLEGEGGLFEQTGLRGIDMATYLVWQKEYFERTGNHLAGATWLTENRRPPSNAPYSDWTSSFNQLFLDAMAPEDHYHYLGCRLAKTIEIEDNG